VTILVVEDDSIQLQILRLILEMDGYTVLVAGNAEEALELTKGHAEDLSLLITDIQMPGMDGIQLSQEITRMRPGIRVLLISGTTPEHVLDYDLRKNFMRKPLLPGVLREKVGYLIKS
jgi:CheY-like chemotaxis protein